MAARAVGGYPGHARIHPKVLERVARVLKEQVKAGTITDSGIIHCGDLLGLLLTGVQVPGDLIERTFAAGQNEATELHLCTRGAVPELSSSRSPSGSMSRC